jgi:DNA-directed RNA polymerase subunit RPC12/RpoP
MGVTEGEAATVRFYRAVGCDQCHQTGYKGRVGIYEIMPVTDELRRLIAQKGAEAPLRAAACAGGMLSLGEDGILKVKAGTTTPEELLRVVTEVRRAAGVCSECGQSVAHDFVACPECGHRVDGRCARCGQSLRPDWNYCPYCAESSRAVAEHAEQHVSRFGAVR